MSKFVKHVIANLEETKQQNGKEPNWTRVVSWLQSINSVVRANIQSLHMKCIWNSV